MIKDVVKCGYMKIDPHCHTRPSSLCSTVSPDELVNLYIKNGYDGVVLTNHYREGHIDQFGSTKEEKIAGFIADYHATLNAAKDKNFKVFLGAEIKVRCDLICENEKGEVGPVNSEFLLYGISEDFLWRTFNLTQVTQKEAFELCCAENVLMYQSHPLRARHYCVPLDARYMHGMEVFNPHFNSKVKETLEIANKNNLLLSGGSDTHDLVVEHFAGMLVPSDINDQFELRDYLKTGENFIICEDGVLIENGKLLLDIKY